MIKIIEIIYLTKKKAKVLIEGGPSLILYSGEIKKLHWREGDVIDDELYDKVRKETVEKRAKLYALHLLQDQDRTENEILNKLKRASYDPEIAQVALDYVKKFGYVNDEKYAARFIENYRRIKSNRQIRQDLMKKGIDRDILDNALEDGTADDDEYHAILRLLRKRHYSPEKEREDNEDKRKEREKQMRYLASKGFSYQSVRYVLDHYEELSGDE